MNLCLVSFQAVLVAVLVHCINEVEAKKESYVSIGKWLSSIEKKIDDVPERIRMKEIFQQIKKTTKNILAYPGHFFREVFGIGTYHKNTNNRDLMNKDHKADVIFNLLHSQELKDLIAVNDISDMTDEIEFVEEPEPPYHVTSEKPENPKRKRKIKKHKKKIKVKHEQLEHIPNEQRLDASIEQDKAQFEERYHRRRHKKSEKERVNQRKFVKAVPKESNSSESDEVIRRKPVDIIVHIKMNE